MKRPAVTMSPDYVEQLAVRYMGIGPDLSHDEKELLLFALYNESEARGGLIESAKRTAEAKAAGHGISQVDMDVCPHCHQMIPFTAFDYHVKNCKESQNG